MTTPDLTDAASRVNWGQGYSQALVDALLAFRQTTPYTTHLHQQGDRWYWTYLRVIPEEEEANVHAEGARLFGTYLDHLRAALNYLTYQVALLSLREDPSLEGKVNPDSVEFPIFNDSRTFRSKNRVKQLPEEYLDRFEKVQPYNGGNDGLWILHELARQYRHRVIHPVDMHPFGRHKGVFSDNLPSTAQDVDITYTGGPLKHGDHLCSFTSSGPVDPDAYPKIVLSIGVDHPICQGKTLITILNTISMNVANVLNEWSGSPLVHLGQVMQR